ncbi:hypothetical protein ACFV7R_44485 [Streptomyces sp. NPDC059866]|uniref:hypothetical protein n=1 Tax=Streptomyces sp. NPDC059866 TaxID=3346978 RepID=UPI003653AE1C
MTSAAHAPGDSPPHLAWDDLHRHAGEGLTVLLGPTSEPVRALSAGRPDLAEHLLAPWRQLPGIQLRLETCRLNRVGTGPGSLRPAARTLTPADQLDIPAVLANAVRYADRDRHRLADVLDAARLLRSIDRRHLDSGEHRLKDPAAMHEIARRIAAAPARPAAAAHRVRGGTPPPKPERPDTTPAKAVRKQGRTDEASRKPAQAQREAEAAEQRTRQREDEHDQAQAEVERAEAALRELEERGTELARQLHATVELRRRMRNDLDDARNCAAQTDRAVRQARHAAEAG